MTFRSTSSDVACFSVASTRQPKSVFREDSVPEFEEVRNDRKPAQPDDGAESNGPVEPTKNFDADNPGSVRKPPLDFVHEILHRFAVVCRMEGRVRNVGEANPLLSIHPAKHLDFSATQRAGAVKEDFYTAVVVRSVHDSFAVSSFFESLGGLDDSFRRIKISFRRRGPGVKGGS